MNTFKFLAFTTFLLISICLSGAVTTWTGGTGNWDVDSNWDTGIVPAANDDVIISSGYVTIPASYSAVALSVSISNSSVLEIANTGTLQIDNAPVNGIAISTGASLLNAGEINIDSPDIFGVQNSTGTFHNQSTGEIYITNAGIGGIKNYQTGAVLTNDGLIRIDETSLGDGIYSETELTNNIYASIIIKNTASNGLDSYNGLVTNYGTIVIDSTGDDGMLIRGNTFDNSGDVEISHCYDGYGSNGAMGIYAIAGIKNRSDGSIYVHHVESSAIRTVGDIENSGLIEIYDNDYIGVFVGDGTLSNQETGEIKIKNNDNHAIHLYMTELENDGLLLFDNNAGKAINTGSGSPMYNNASGTIKGNGLISGGNFYDSGTLSPGDSIGSLEIFGYRPDLPTYNMEIVGTTGAGISDGYDLSTLNISSGYSLQGTVNISFLGDYSGASQDTFYMFSIPSGYTGNFDAINLPALPAGLSWETIYSADNVKFVINGSEPISCDDFTVYLKDSNGDLLAGGMLEFRDGGWQTATEIEDGVYCVSTDSENLNLRMTYADAQLYETVSTSSAYTFQTVLVTFELRKRTGVLGYNFGQIFYQSSGNLLATTGDAGLGLAQKELLPREFTFRMKFRAGIGDITQDITVDPVVSWQMARMLVQINKSDGTRGLNGADIKYKGSNQEHFGITGTNENGRVRKDLLPGFYKFTIKYLGGKQVVEDFEVTVGDNELIIDGIAATVELLESGTNNPVDGAKVSNIGVTSNLMGYTGDSGSGIVTVDLLPVIYSFVVNYDGDQDTHDGIDITTTPWVTFYTDDLKSADVSYKPDHELAAYPNPFVENTTIAFSLGNTEEVSVAIYDRYGRMVEMLYDGNIQKGNHKLSWDGYDVHKGIYIVRFSSNGKLFHRNIVKM